MNLLLHWTRDIQGDRKRIRALASIGTIYFILFIFTFCLSAIIIYNLYGKSRFLESENEILKEIIESIRPTTDEDCIRELEKLEDGYIIRIFDTEIHL